MQLEHRTTELNELLQHYGLKVVARPIYGLPMNEEPIGYKLCVVGAQFGTNEFSSIQMRGWKTAKDAECWFQTETGGRWICDTITWRD